ncbi:hypothetical protein HME9302_02586 [Alteripontixanthobacter maritimus]|uniref:Uncharacterized protein n=1 Tax=Alteripontixanthobacter maritimus TaxID=2161824 RepID=A0A369Q9I4_9SPHN|nr:hypothetical protein [Alteripontixanthobacter maritimus]RDC61364.1 hypothetical protein HME9302_02586 [Alteripontixanthobacter maritimus]
MGRANRWQDKLKYFLKPPGWAHGGKHETSETIRGEAEDAAGEER